MCNACATLRSPIKIESLSHRLHSASIVELCMPPGVKHSSSARHLD